MVVANFQRERAMRYDLARRCEEGIGTRCYCRCRGEKHGARRVDFARNPLGLAALPDSDPHFVDLSRHPREVHARVLTGKDGANV